MSERAQDDERLAAHAEELRARADRTDDPDERERLRDAAAEYAGASLNGGGNKRSA